MSFIKREREREREREGEGIEKYMHAMGYKVKG